MSVSVADFNKGELTLEKIQDLLKEGELDLDWVMRKGIWDGRTFMRRNSGAALRFSGGPPAELANLLLVAAKDSDPEVRLHVVMTLATADMPVRMAMQGLLRALYDREETVRSAAQESLERLSQRVGEDLIEVLVDTLALPDSLARLLTSKLLVRYQEAAAEPLLLALLNENPIQVKEALGTLLRLGMSAAPALVKALKDKRLRQHASRLLMLLAALQPPERKQLDEMTEGDDPALAGIAMDILTQVKAVEKMRSAGDMVIPVPGFTEHILDQSAIEEAGDSGLSIASLLFHVQDGNPVVRANAAALLGVVASKAAPEMKALVSIPLVSMVKDSEADVRRAVVGACARMQTVETVEALVRAVDDTLPEIAAEATSALNNLEPEAIAWLLSTIKAQQPSVCRAAILDATVSAGSAAVGPLAETLRSALNPGARTLAANALARLGDKARAASPALIQGLKDEVDEVREASAIALGLVAMGDPEALQALKACTRDGAPPVRVAASTAIERVQGTYQTPSSVKESEPIPIEGFEERLLDPLELAKAAAELPASRLVPALSDGRPTVRTNTAVALGFNRDDKATAARVLAVAGMDGEGQVRLAAISALKQLGAEVVKQSAPVFIRALGDRDRDVAQAARTALTDLGAQAIPSLMQALDCDPDRAQRTILPLLAGLGEAAVEGLVESLSHLSVRVRGNAARGLQQVGTTAGGATGALVDALCDTSEDVREAAAIALGFVAPGDDNAINALKKATRDGALPVRVAASIAMERVKGTYRPPTATKESEPVGIEGFEERPLTSKELAKPASELPAARLIPSLYDGRATVRHNAALALGHSTDNPAGAAMALGIATMDGESSVRLAAVSALGLLGAGVMEVSGPILIRALGDPAKEVAEAARGALAELGNKAIPSLIDALDSDPDRVARTVLPVLASRGESAIQPLVHALDHLSVRVRANAARGLGLLGQETARPAREAVEKATLDPNDMVKAAAKHALDAIDGVVPAPRTLEAEPPPLPDFDTQVLEPDDLKKQAKKLDVNRLIRALADGRVLMRTNAATALGMMGKNAAASVNALALAVRDESPEVRASAATALGRLGTESIDLAVPALLRAAADPVPEVAQAAVASLDGLGGDALEALVQALDMDPDRATQTVLPALTRLGVQTVPALIKALHHLSVHKRANAARALGMIGPEAGAPARGQLKAALADADDLVKAYARRAIDAIDGVVPPPRVTEAEPLPLPDFDSERMEAEALKKQSNKLDIDRLCRALSDGRLLVRINAATALAVIGSTAAKAAGPLALTVRDENPEVRQQAAAALGALGTEGMDLAVPALLQAMLDPVPVVADAARQAIMALGADAIPALVSALARDPAVAEKTVIPALVAQGQAIISPVSRALHHLSVWVRANAVLALGLLGPEQGTAAKAAVKAAMRDANDLVRKKANQALDLIEGNEPPPLVFESEPLPLPDFDNQSLDPEFLKKQAKSMQVDRLKRGLFDGRTYVRENAARALGTMGKAAEEALIELLVALKDTEWSVREATAIALGQLKFAPEKSVPALALALKGKSSKLEPAVVEAIDRFGKAAIEPLMNTLSERPEAVLPSVGRVCFNLPDTFLKPLTDRLGAQHSIVVRENAADVIGAMGKKARPIKKAMLEALEEKDILFRVKMIRAASDVLGRDEDLLKALKQIKDSDSRPSIQWVLEDLFRRIGLR